MKKRLKKVLQKTYIMPGFAIAISGPSPVQEVKPVEFKAKNKKEAQRKTNCAFTKAIMAVLKKACEDGTIK